MNRMNATPHPERHAPSPALFAHDRAPLPHNRWFHDLPQAARQAMLAHARSRFVAAGDALRLHDVACDDWFAVHRGCVRLSAVFACGKVMTLSFLMPGDWYGELSAADALPQRIDTVAHSDSTVLVLRRDAMKRIVVQEPALLPALLKMSCARLTEMMRLIEELQSLPLGARLAGKILAMAALEGSDPCGARLRLTQQDWADLLGASRPRINGHLRTLAHEGVIALEHRGLRVLRSERLRELALQPDSDGRRRAAA